MRRLLIMCAAGLVVAGCGSSNSSSSSSGKSPSIAPSSSTPASTPAAGGGGQKLSLSADSGGAIKFDKSTLKAKAGKVTIVMNNPSSSGVMHGIAVEGKGVDKDGSIVSPGSTSTVSVSLKPGTYEFYCPYDGHKGQGMEGKLVVS
jgi:uncharacterized cupredoxin-like copper-binding protein